MIGKSVPRVDAYDKVTGRARFTDDMILNHFWLQRFIMLPSEMAG